MYKEKQEFMKFLEDLSAKYDLGWDYAYMYRLSSAMSRKLDEVRFLSKDEFIELLEHNYGNPEDYKDIDFNDQIIKIEELPEDELIDIEVQESNKKQGDNLFYANGILTHNSAFGNTEVGMENTSESIGLAATADTMLAMIATEQMRELNQVQIKFLKNRNTGRLDSTLLESDYPKMRYTDYDTDNPAIKETQEAITINNMDTGLDFGSINF